MKDDRHVPYATPSQPQTQRPRILIEQTSKRWKAHKLGACGLLFLSLFPIGFGAVKPDNALLFVGGVCAAGAIVWLFVASLMSWWESG